jgi:hypothetical protein
MQHSCGLALSSPSKVLQALRANRSPHPDHLHGVPAEFSSCAGFVVLDLPGFFPNWILREDR